MNNKTLRAGEPYVYISVADQDLAQVERLVGKLTERGFRILRAAGSDAASVDADTMKAIRGCALFLAFVSEASAESPYCRMERDYAQEQERNILDILLEESEYEDLTQSARPNERRISRPRLSASEFDRLLFSAVEDALLAHAEDLAPARELAEIDKSWSMLIVGWFAVIGLIAFALMVWLEY